MKGGQHVSEERVLEEQGAPPGEGCEEGPKSSPTVLTPRVASSPSSEAGGVGLEARATPARGGGYCGGAAATPLAEVGSGVERGVDGKLRSGRGAVEGSKKENGGGGGLDESTRLLQKQLTCPLTQV